MTTPTHPRPAPSTGLTDVPADGRLAASIDAWKRKLLDLSKRNRALNFRTTKVSTVAIVDEHPAEIFRLLYLAEREMRFRGVESASPDATNDVGAPEQQTDAEDEAAAQPEFVPYDAATLDDRHTDEFLQTTATPEALDRSLRRLDEQARLAIEEQGVNTLFLALGMLHYTESDASEQAFNAPLVLLPVELSRKSARSGYRIRAADDEPVVNPALAEYLRLDFGITLPELPDSATIADDYDLQTLLATVTHAISSRRGWSVTSDIVLALFSFQKFVMYKALEANAPAVAAHRLVRQLVGREGDRIIGLPDDVRRLELDREFAPEATAQVVDADSSQLRAIAGVARGYDLVLEGPPGTGKSQTITNLIAQALGAGKSVLFVAEKMAALDVVHSRLVKAGLGEFCLELHSTKASKRGVMRSLAAAIDASLEPVTTSMQAASALPGARTALNDYVGALHTPHGTLGTSPFEAYGALAPVRGSDGGLMPSAASPPPLVPRLRYTRRVDDVARGTLDSTVRELRELAAAARGVGAASQHPWRDATRTLYTEDDIASVREHATDLARRIADVRRQAADVERAFGLPPIRNTADVDTADRIATVVSRSPGAPVEVLSSSAWDAAPSEALRLIERGREVATLRARVEEHFSTTVLEQEHAADIAYVERKSEGLFGFLAFFDGRWRAIRARWTRYRLPAYQPSLFEQASEMKQVDRLAAERKALGDSETVARGLFGDLWQGERSSWEALDAYVQWVVEFRGCVTRYGLGPDAIAVAAQRAPNADAVHALRNATADALGTLEQLRHAIGWPAGYLSAASFEELQQRAESLVANAAAGPRWAAFESARQTVAAGIASEVLDDAMRGTVPFDVLPDAFLRAFYMKWLSEVVQLRPPLARFDALTHEQRIAEFRRLDREVLAENQAALKARLRDRAQERLQDTKARDALPFLQREMAKQRNHSPLRKTLRLAESAVRAIKPCFLMSPLSVAQYLAGGEPSFDVVIFDEASQLPSEDAVGAIARGRQLVVVGDPKQLPPTNFFMVAASPDAIPLTDDGTPLYSDAESVLEEFMGAGVPMSRLRWHYRSAHESLISFSNVAFYDADLFTFPSTETSTSASGLRFVHVDGGTYEGKGLNSVEAKRVVDEVVAFARDQLARRTSGEPLQSLGVGTFNLRQQIAVQDELEVRRRDDPSIEPFFDRSLPEPFFVKNLENIQGDERDAIFLSVTYAKAADGVMRYNFGALNGENGWRRLNVLTTRARRHMRVFSSIRASDINPSNSVSAGPRLLRDFLEYAEHGRLTIPAGASAGATESPFEREVMAALVERGLVVVPQVGVAGYRIDLGVVDAEAPGRFICGIECDGVAYHSSETARDRDRLRHQVLEARGWTLLRVWSTDWFKDRVGQLDRIVRLVEAARQRARDVASSAAQRREAAPEPAVAPSAEPAATGSIDDEYERPVASPYKVADGEGRYAGRELLGEPPATLANAVASVVEVESPVHLDDVIARVAGMWDTRAGTRIHARIVDACAFAQRQHLIERRGDFLWNPGHEPVVRSRAGTRVTADRIAPEEYRAAVMMVLDHGRGFSRPALVTEVRSILGFSRTGAALDEAIGSVLDAMLTEGVLGEGSTGVRLR